jgi:hypothetical protein
MATSRSSTVMIAQVSPLRVTLRCTAVISPLIVTACCPPATRRRAAPDGAVGRGRQHVLEPISGWLDTYRPEHLPLEPEQRLLVPLGMSGTRTVIEPKSVVEAAEQRVLADRLVALDVGVLVDRVLVDRDERAPAVPEGVERARLGEDSTTFFWQTIAGTLSMKSEKSENLPFSSARPRSRPRRWCRRCAPRADRTGCPPHRGEVAEESLTSAAAR